MTDLGGALHSRRMTGAAAWRLTFLAVQGGSSVVLFVVLSHVLGRRALAATAVAQGVIVIAQAIGDFGLSQAAVTVLPARIAGARERSDGLLSGAATAYIGATLLGGVLTLVAVPLVPASASGPVAISAFAAAASVVVAGADGLLRSQGNFRRPLTLMAVSEFAGFAGIPAAVLTDSAFWTCAAVALGMAAGALPAAILLIQTRRLTRERVIGPFIRASVPLGVSQVFIALGTRVDTLLAGAVSGLLAAGTFEGSWRVYQLSQYVAGGVASAAAPFIADAIGSDRARECLHMLRVLLLELAGLGLVGGAILVLLRAPLADLVVGALGPPVARVLLPLALISPLQAVSAAAYYTLIGLDGERRLVLFAIVAGAAVNLALATELGSDQGARGVVIGCAAGQAVTAVLLLFRLVPFVRRLRHQAAGRTVSPGLTRPVR